MYDCHFDLFKVKLQAGRQGKAMVVIAQNCMHWDDLGDGSQERGLNYIAGVDYTVRLSDTVPDNCRQVPRP